MPPVKTNPRAKNLNHFLSCDRCGFTNLPCPRAVNEEPTKLDKQTQCNEIVNENSKDILDQGHSANSDLVTQIMKLNIGEKCIIIQKILRSEMELIKADKASCHIGKNATIESIGKIDHQKWYDERCVLLKAIGNELAKGGHERTVVQEGRDSNLNILNKKINLMQSIFKLIDTKFVSSIGASSNLLHFTASHSPLSSTVLAATGSGGGYAMAQKLINNLPPEPLDSPGDQIEVVDNNGQDGNTYNAKKNSMKRVSLVTARMVFRINPEGLLQKNVDFKPENYLFTKKENENPTPNISSSIINVQMKPSLTSQDIYKQETLRKLRRSFERAKSGFSRGKLEDSISESVNESVDRARLGKRKNKTLCESNKRVKRDETGAKDIDYDQRNSSQEAAGSSSDHTQAAGSRSDPTQAARSRSDHTQAAGSRSDHTQAAGSRSDHTQAAGSRSDHTQAAGSRSDHTLAAGSRSEHTVAGSTSDHSKAAWSGRDHSEAAGSTSDHNKAAGSTSDHTKAERPTSDYIKDGGSRSDHTKGAGLRSDQTEAAGSRSDHTEVAGSTSDHTKAAGSTSGHTKAAGSTSDHTKALGSTSDHTNNGGTTSDHTNNGGSTSDHTNNGGTSDHNKAGGSVSDHTEAARSTSDHTEAAVLTSDHTKAGGSRSDHTKDGGSTSDHTKAAGARSGHTKDGGSTSNHTEAAGSRSGHTEAAESRIDHTEAAESRSGHTKAAGSRSDHTKSAGSRSDHTKAAGSRSNHTKAAGSASDHTKAERSTSDYIKDGGSQSDHIEATGSTSDHNEAAGSRTEHNKATGSTSDHTESAGSGSYHTQDGGSRRYNTKAEGSTSDHNKAAGLTSDHTTDGGSTREHTEAGGSTRRRPQQEKQVQEESFKRPTREQIYGRIPHHHLLKQTPLIMDPILENPNSFITIQVVFREILSKNVCREWIILYSDGVPYWLGYKVIMWSYLCNECDAKVFREVGWTKHCKECHPGMDNVTRRLEFGKILLMPGAGHIGMQMVKGLRRATFKVWGDVNAEVLGCRSPKANLWYQNANDTHQGLEHTLIEDAALSDEIMATYIHDQMSQGRPLEELSVEDFLKSWIGEKKQSCPNLKFAFDMTTKYYMSVEIFNIGVRRNNPDYIQCGLDFFRDFWHVMNTPIYRPLSELFETTKNLLPSEIRDFVISSQSLRTSKDLTSGQGVDFRMEECNQNIQAQLPPGAPTEQVWIRTYRNYDSLMANRKNWFDQHGLKDPCSQENLRVDYFNLNNKIHTGLRGNLLHPQLASFKELAPKARVENLKKVVAQKSFLELSKTEIELYVEHADERKRTQKSLTKINEIIRDKIDALVDPDEREIWNCLWNPYKELNTKQAAWCFLDKLESNDKTV